MSKTGGVNWQDKLGPQDSVTFTKQSQLVLEMVPKMHKLVVSEAEVRASEGVVNVHIKCPQWTADLLNEESIGSNATVISALIQFGFDYLKQTGQTLLVRNRIEKK